MPYDYDAKEYSIILKWDCPKCEHYNDDYQASYHKGDTDVYVFCTKCGEENEISLAWD